VWVGTEETSADIEEAELEEARDLIYSQIHEIESKWVEETLLLLRPMARNNLALF
jgi:hypothetical protein